MKKLFQLFLIFFCLQATAFAQTNEADKILGTYMSAGDKGKVVKQKTVTITMVNSFGV